ncbi:MAG: hypothetical protein IJU81_05380, partial [Bacteroidales bacterium]|nr:hypothetical protein [Bacteroidales bacterium]
MPAVCSTVSCSSGGSCHAVAARSSHSRHTRRPLASTRLSLLRRHGSTSMPRKVTRLSARVSRTLPGCSVS